MQRCAVKTLIDQTANVFPMHAVRRRESTQAVIAEQGFVAPRGIRVNAISPLGTTRMSETFKADGKTPDKSNFVDPTLNGPFVAYLCSEQANWITGQVFGSGGERVVIMEQPVYGTGMFKPGGWSVEDLQEHMPKFFKGKLEPVGLFKKPYPYYDGVKPA